MTTIRDTEKNNFRVLINLLIKTRKIVFLLILANWIIFFAIGLLLYGLRYKPLKMEVECIRQHPNFSNKVYQVYPFQSSLMYYILANASLPTQIKLSQTCKELHEKLYNRHRYHVDELWMNPSKSTYRIYDGKVKLYPSTQFLLQLPYPFIVNKTVILFNINAVKIEQVLEKIDYSMVKEFYFSCCTVEFTTLKKILKIPSLKLISYWSSNVVNAGKIDIDDYVFEKYPNVYVNDPD